MAANAGVSHDHEAAPATRQKRTIQREQPGDPAEMWDRIVREVSADEPSFMSLVGRNSKGNGFEAGELLVIVSPGKLKIAEDKSQEISRIAKALYGDEVFVTLRGGDPSRKSGNAEAVTEAETSKILDEDIDQNEIASDIESLFGITPTIEA
jgi:hypothetical protein